MMGGGRKRVSGRGYAGREEESRKESSPPTSSQGRTLSLANTCSSPPRTNQQKAREKEGG